MNLNLKLEIVNFKLQIMNLDIWELQKETSKDWMGLTL